jgi:diaminohydroxyphosphoribosylaminopyrimidine deaminase/5-amino-6-(5-phosphoribosylamino)uracil reductase
VDRIMAAGIRRVVAAISDPDSRVSGRGFEILRQKGVDVSVGAGRERALRLNRAYLTFKTRQRPFIIMKAATSLDNRVAARPGERTQITSRDSLRHAHAVRAEVDAIAVGSGTIIADNPLLTVREVHRHRPLARVLFDRRLRIDPSARVFSTLSAGPVIIITTPESIESHSRRALDLERAGAELEPIRNGGLVEAFGRLGDRQLLSLVLEGGVALQAAAWDAGLVDAVHVYVAPVTLGDAALPWLDSDTISIASLLDRRVLPLGPDVFMEGYVHGID